MIALVLWVGKLKSCTRTVKLPVPCSPPFPGSCLDVWSLDVCLACLCPSGQNQSYQQAGAPALWADEICIFPLQAGEWLGSSLSWKTSSVCPLLLPVTQLLLGCSCFHPPVLNWGAQSQLWVPNSEATPFPLGEVSLHWSLHQPWPLPSLPHAHPSDFSPPCLLNWAFLVFLAKGDINIFLKLTVSDFLCSYSLLCVSNRRKVQPVTSSFHLTGHLYLLLYLTFFPHWNLQQEYFPMPL